MGLTGSPLELSFNFKLMLMIELVEIIATDSGPKQEIAVKLLPLAMTKLHEEYGVWN